MKPEALPSKQVTRFVDSILAEDLHAKRVALVASATLGAVEAASLSIHAESATFAKKLIEEACRRQGIEPDSSPYTPIVGRR